MTQHAGYGMRPWSIPSKEKPTVSAEIRRFETGATRDTNAGKLEFARFLDPRVIRRYAEYMNRHRIQSDGTLREPDNWRNGMPLEEWMGSLWRHVYDVWEIHTYGSTVRPETGQPVDIEDALAGVLFNAMGYMHEVLRAKAAAKAVPAESRTGTSETVG